MQISVRQACSQEIFTTSIRDDTVILYVFVGATIGRPFILLICHTSAVSRLLPSSSLRRGGTQCRSDGLRAADDRPYSHSHTGHRRMVLLPFIRFTYGALRHRPLLYLNTSFTPFRRGDQWSPFYFAHLPLLCRFTTAPLKGHTAVAILHINF